MFYNLMPVDEYNMLAPHGQIRIEHDRVHEMINDTFGVQGRMEPEQYFDEDPNEKARRFYDNLEDPSRPLCEGSPHSALSVVSKPIGRITIDNFLDLAYQNEVAIVQQQVDVELETTLEHP
ncbi:hypothetical protein H5410_021900 [Solanum commersonii]|uniref:Uncharacterized protein n=1 Tax=Solanum commersonii TaxID=4109 RepID=A0A9J5ZCC9_SOLCO|nr:hypothetical protein H5410_021900 [Solanum commersonii]